ncbi:MAG: hypothetical protein QNJ46_06835 [Leptolyngbyaceae cyanobacterium MO_188.B28]|nr:hypothetical protein [Leptolyngbyaceae cyanobacterium MO_188.B28]
MRIHWKKLLAKTLVWVVAEILLTLLGLDNLADYSEFIFARNIVVLNVQ